MAPVGAGLEVCISSRKPEDLWDKEDLMDQLPSAERTSANSGLDWTGSFGIGLEGAKTLQPEDIDDDEPGFGVS